MVESTHLGRVRAAIDAWREADAALIRETTKVYRSIAAKRGNVDAGRALQALKLHVVYDRHAMAQNLIDREQQTFGEGT
jgi:hypothetical protein